VSQSNKFYGNGTDTLLRNLQGQDASYLLTSISDGKNARNCLNARYAAGVISSDSMGCIADDIIVDVMLAVIIGLIVVRFTMAVVFSWFIAGRLTKPGGRSQGVLAWRSVAGGNAEPDRHRPPPESRYAVAAGNYPDPSGSTSSLGGDSSASASASDSPAPLVAAPKPKAPPKPKSSSQIVDTRLHTIMLVTCYSEGKASIKTTLDSLASTTYSRKHKVSIFIPNTKMVFVIC
jgi:chitin synthase